MIPVQPVLPPADFQEKVRKPGLRAIAELVGEAPQEPTRGRRRQPVAERREDIPHDKFPPFWTRALDDLLGSYGRVCMYVAVYIERVTGAASVDHMIPKSVAWDSVYEWDNYRLACAIMNSRKGVIQTVLDPFEIKDGWFELEPVGFQVLPGQNLPPDIERRVKETIDALKLNDRECRRLREEHATDYWNEDVTLAHLRKRSPFVASELERLGRLNE